MEKEEESKAFLFSEFHFCFSDEMIVKCSIYRGGGNFNLFYVSLKAYGGSQVRILWNASK